MVDGRRFRVNGGFIKAVQLGIELAYVCNLDFDDQCVTIWNFFEALMGLRSHWRDSKSLTHFLRLLFGESIECKSVPFIR